MRQTNWQLCSGGYHFWPYHLKEAADRCCANLAEMPHASLTLFVPDYLCTSGKHCWSKSEEALRCCDGYLPIWKPMGTPHQVTGLFRMLSRVLVPTAAVTDMDVLASVPGQQPQLYWPM